MVTIGEQLKNLEQQKKEAKTISQIPIPKRTFRGGVGKRQQQAVIEIRQKGKQALSQIETQRKQLIAVQKQQRGLEEQKRALATAQKLFKRQEEGKAVNIVSQTGLVKKFFNLLQKGKTAQFQQLKQETKEQLKDVPETAVIGTEKGATVSKSVLESLLEKASKGDVQSQDILKKILKKDTVVITEKKVETEEKPKTTSEKFDAFIDKNIERLDKIKTERAGKTTKEIGLVGAGVLFGVGAGISVLTTVSGTAQLIRQPRKTIEETLGGIGTAIKEPKKTITSLKDIAVAQPEASAGFIATEIVTLAFISKGLSVLGKVTSKGLTRISPKFVKTLETGKTTKVIKKVPFKEKIIDIPVAQTVGKISEPVSKLVKFSGKRLRLVSAQVSLLSPFLQRSRKLLKPLFFEPRGRARIGRLGLGQKDAGLLDILRGNFTFFRGRKQLFITEQRIEKIPPDIFKTLEAGKTLTSAQLKRFKKFVKEPTGIKPVPKLTTEPEVIIPAGFTVERGKKLAVTLIKKEPVEIAEINIRLDKQIDKLISKKTISDLDRVKISEKLTKSISQSSKNLEPKPFLSPSASAVSVANFSKKGISKGVSKKGVLKPPISPPISPPRLITTPSLPPFKPPKLPPLIAPPTKTPSIKLPPSITPKFSPPFKFFPTLRGEKRKRKGKEKEPRDDLFLVAGFTGRALGITKKIKEKDIVKVASREKGLGVRGTPIIIK